MLAMLVLDLLLLGCCWSSRYCWDAVARIADAGVAVAGVTSAGLLLLELLLLGCCCSNC